MKEEKRKKIITKTFNELYNAFYHLYQYKKDDILYNGYDEEEYMDCFGHYFEYNGRRYTADIGYPEEFGYIPDNPKNCFGVCVYRFISDEEFAHKNVDAYIQFTFNIKTEQIQEILELEIKKTMYKLEVNYEECEQIIFKEQLKIDTGKTFEYITEGFGIEKDIDYRMQFYIDNDVCDGFF